MKQSIGMIGLGRMGGNMARRIARAGLAVVARGRAAGARAGISAEEGVTAYVVDPGDMRTGMHQDAFPGEDISDRPLPDSVVPHLLALLEARPPSGRYRAADILLEAVAGQGAR